MSQREGGRRNTHAKGRLWDCKARSEDSWSFRRQLLERIFRQHRILLLGIIATLWHAKRTNGSSSSFHPHINFSKEGHRATHPSQKMTPRRHSIREFLIFQSATSGTDFADNIEDYLEAPSWLLHTQNGPEAIIMFFTLFLLSLYLFCTFSHSLCRFSENDKTMNHGRWVVPQLRWLHWLTSVTFTGSQQEVFFYL